MKKKRIMGVCIILGVMCCLSAGYLMFGEKQEKAGIQVEDISIAAGEELPDLVEDIGQTETVSSVMVDASGVDTGKPGEYPVTYYYADEAGNQYTKSVICTVTENADTETLQEEATEE